MGITIPLANKGRYKMNPDRVIVVKQDCIKIHKSNGGNYLDFPNCCSLQEEWKIENLYRFLKTQCNHKKDPYLLPFTKDVLNMVAQHEVYYF